jgi:hypothetical protein
MLGQIAQHRQGPGTQGEDLGSPPELTLRHIQSERPKGEVISRLHGVSCRLGFNGVNGKLNIFVAPQHRY